MKIKAEQPADVAPKEEPVRFTSDMEEAMCDKAVSEPTEESEVEPAPAISVETMKKVVWACLINGILWVWASYILAALDKVQIAESLSQVALKEIIAVVFVYAVKSLFENLSKNNNWPDKPPKDDPPGLG